MEPAALAGQPDKAAVLLKGGSRPRAMVWHRENDLGLIEIYTQNSEQGLPTKVAELSRGPTAGHLFHCRLSLLPFRPMDRDGKLWRFAY